MRPPSMAEMSRNSLMKNVHGGTFFIPTSQKSLRKTSKKLKFLEILFYFFEHEHTVVSAESERAGGCTINSTCYPLLR